MTETGRLKLFEVTLGFHCAKCGVYLGYYKGKLFYLYASLLNPEVKFLCAECWKKEAEKHG